MNNNTFENDMELYEQHERQLADQANAFLSMLTTRGLLGDETVKDSEMQRVKQERKRRMYHNTSLLLKHYREIKWVLECFPGEVATDLDLPMRDLDAILNAIDTEIGMENRKLESRLQSVMKSRLLIDRLNEALTLLRKKPENGEQLYQAIYYTFLCPDKLSYEGILNALELSPRHYYRLRGQAISILAIRLWSTPAGGLDAWLDVLTLLETL